MHGSGHGATSLRALFGKVKLVGIVVAIVEDGEVEPQVRDSWINVVDIGFGCPEASQNECLSAGHDVATLLRIGGQVNVGQAGEHQAHRASVRVLSDFAGLVCAVQKLVDDVLNCAGVLFELLLWNRRSDA